MEATKEDTKKANCKDILKVFTELAGRIQLANKLGVDTYGGDRDIYNAWDILKV